MNRIKSLQNSVTRYIWNLFIMLKRRTSKRFVLGDNDEVHNFDDEEPVEVIPASVVQKFQMTLAADPEESVTKEEAVKEDGKLLRPPITAGTLQ